MDGLALTIRFEDNNCANHEKKKNDIDCRHGGDTENDCEGCVYSGEYHFQDGKCVLRINLKGGSMENNMFDVLYVSVWDGGVEITTSAKVDIRTGEITEVEKVNVDGLDSCEREYVVMNDVQVEVYRNEHGYELWADMKNEL